MYKIDRRGGGGSKNRILGIYLIYESELQNVFEQQIDAGFCVHCAKFVIISD